jgi:hypothetical protein
LPAFKPVTEEVVTPVLHVYEYVPLPPLIDNEAAPFGEEQEVELVIAGVIEKELLPSPIATVSTI